MSKQRISLNLDDQAEREAAAMQQMRSLAVYNPSWYRKPARCTYQRRLASPPRGVSKFSVR
jgi:hypothetical protein